MATKKAPSQPAKPPIVQQPQSKQQAAKQVGMTLHTNSAWSDAYWDPNDLHCQERVLFA